MSPRFLIPALLLCATGSALAAEPARRAYIVQLADKPAASYEGGIAGLGATRAMPGKQLDARSSGVARYTGFLRQKQQALLAKYRGARVLHSYQLVYNGFSALLTQAEARTMRQQPGVRAVIAEQPRKLDTHHTPSFLGLDQPGGLWSQLGGSAKAGEDVVIGVIDTGIWPEHTAFADRVDADGKPTHAASGTLVYGAPPASWQGTCETGEGFTVAACNNKLIGARSFSAGRLAEGARLHSNEFLSPRDGINIPGSGRGHGTHTASTAGGNHGVAVALDGVPAGAASGMAPRARIAAYKVCWTHTLPAWPEDVKTNCMPSDSVAAIEQAVADGVDVLNFSIGGSWMIDDPVDQAFLGAATAGVFVATSAGNEGPYLAVAHSVPWLATVAATNHDKVTGAILKVAGGPILIGGSLNRAPLPPTPFIFAHNAGSKPFDQLSDADRYARAMCFSEADAKANGAGPDGLVDPKLVAGKVLVCEAGAIEPKAKSVVAKAAGAAGMVLLQFNEAPHHVDYAVPTVDLLPVDGEALVRHLAEHPDALLEMSAFGIQDNPLPSPSVVRFSSPGPNIVAPGVMKPDLAAPGLEILAGITPRGDQQYRDGIVKAGTAPDSARFGFHTGTSMASPHVAGVAALLRQRHPGWSPAAIKSALMTSASQTPEGELTGALSGTLPWGQGAGFVQPTAASDPGLVYDAGQLDWQRFLCGTESISVPAETCRTVGATPDTDLNQAALTAPSVAVSEVLKRTVKNVGATAATYRAEAQLDGFDVAVSPAELTLAPGETGSFTVTLTRTTAENLAWSYGYLEWNDGAHRVRSPLQARAMIIDAPNYLIADQRTGRKLIPITAGSTAKLKVNVSGLAPPSKEVMTVQGAIEANAALAACLAGGNEQVVAKTVSIPAGTLAARFAVFGSDSLAGSQGWSDWLNLFVIDPHRQLVGYVPSSGNGSAATTYPEPGEYTVCVASEAPHDGVSATFALSSWVIGPGQDAGNLRVSAPAVLGKGSTGTVGMTWSGLDEGKYYYGVLAYQLNGRTELVTQLALDPIVPEGLPQRAFPMLKSAPVTPPPGGAALREALSTVH
ncbi:S8 family serine peptidase [Pseudoduganella lutea]|uniref:Peptidase S8 and S53 subtilisin kexin sedolisin n=1 Tax=Pseudoduganella lutea TaxID=321985 RepID=A0A4P6L2R7_9BURK|nr:S8 family serine peptidase [Pseudoduganella lutea]QBE65674.1 peptidase S8 and S53 subtilisin kexin sedolisin [Pseudoduganella lutea]